MTPLQASIDIRSFYPPVFGLGRASQLRAAQLVVASTLFDPVHPAERAVGLVGAILIEAGGRATASPRRTCRQSRKGRSSFPKLPRIWLPSSSRDSPARQQPFRLLQRPTARCSPRARLSHPPTPPHPPARVPPRWQLARPRSGYCIASRGNRSMTGRWPPPHPAQLCT